VVVDFCIVLSVESFLIVFVFGDVMVVWVVLDGIVFDFDSFVVFFELNI